MLPKNRCSMGRLSRTTIRPISTPAKITVYNSCLADLLASSLCLAPRHWEVTTAPPVASAAMILNIRILIMSTSETPDTAASPTEEIIMVSAMPTVMASACSKISGMISFRRSLPEKAVPFLSSMSFQLVSILRVTF